MNRTSVRGYLALAVIVGLGGCGGMRSGAEAAVRDALKDPESARFGAFYFNKETKRGCLTVNAKNSMGGYTGDQQAYVEQTEKGWEVHGIGEIDQDGCRKVHADAKR